MPGSWPIRELPYLDNDNCEITSPPTRHYNCIAWAADENARWWWPDPQGIGYWPPGVQRAATLEAFEAAYATLGYEPCTDSSLEPDIEKIAIFALNLGGLVVPTHAAIQLTSGQWSSKLGEFEDITHDRVEDVRGPVYGSVALPGDELSFSLSPIGLKYLDLQMQGPGRTQPVAALLDSSLVEVGQILALAAVLGCDSSRQARLAGLSVSRNSLQTAAFSELMVRFYRGEQPGSAPGRASVPVGMFDGETAVESAPPMIARVLARTGPDSAPLYPRGIGKLNDTADPVAVLRNALSAQQDQSAVMVLAGPAVNLLGLMALPEGSELIRNKVRALVVASDPGSGGVAGLVEHWPGPIVTSGEDLNLRYPAAAIDEDFAWAPSHPVVDAWRAAGTLAEGAPAHAAAAVLYAVHPEEGYFGLSGIAASGESQRQRLTLDTEQRERAVQAIRELVAAMPPEPRRGGRGGFP